MADQKEGQNQVGTTYDPQMPMAEDNKLARGAENVEGFESVAFSVFNVQNVHNLGVGKA